MNSWIIVYIEPTFGILARKEVMADTAEDATSKDCAGIHSNHIISITKSDRIDHLKWILASQKKPQHGDHDEPS
jgi:hypothetical protein